MLTARTQIKDILKEAGIDNISADFMETLNEKVKQLVIDAANRAKKNSRKTVMGRDI